MKANPNCVCGHAKSAHFCRYDGALGRNRYGAPCFGDNDKAGECACEGFMKAKKQPKPVKVPCGWCEHGILQRMPSQDTYACRSPRGASQSVRNSVCNRRNCSAAEYAERVKRVRK